MSEVEAPKNLYLRLVAKSCIHPGWIMICKPAPDHTALCTHIVPIPGPPWRHNGEKWYIDGDEQTHLETLDYMLAAVGAMGGYPMISPEELEFIKRVRPDIIAVTPAIELMPETEVDLTGMPKEEL